MEDLLYYIGLGAVITISLVRKARKAAKQQTAQQANNNPATPAMPSQTEIEQMLYQWGKPKQHTQTTTTTSVYPSQIEYKDEAQSLEVIIDEVAIATEPTSKRPSKPQKAHKKAKNAASTATAQQRVTTQNNTINEQDTKSNDFDLREAVIYAEILKPKFEEE